MAMYGARGAYGQSEMDDEDEEETEDLPYLSHMPFSKVEEEWVNWLWPGRIPLGAITLLDGDPGLGKSLLTLDLAARVSTGREMPDGVQGLAPRMVLPDGEVKIYDNSPAPILLLSAEDDPARTIRPRLLAAGADLERVEMLGDVITRNPATGRTTTRPFRLPLDIPYLEDALVATDALLVVIDPLMAYLAPGVNSWRDQDVRAALAPLADLARRSWAAILILRHLNKAAGSSAIYRGGGSIGIIGAARSGLLVAKSPDDPDHERVLAATKSNLGPPMPSLRYRVEAREDRGSGESIPWIDWLGESSLGATALLAAPQTTPEPSNPKMQQALEWLYTALAGEPRPGREIERESLAAGIAVGTLRRAREQLGIIIERRGYGEAMRSWWRLDEGDGGEEGDVGGDTGAPNTGVAGQSDAGQAGEARE